MDCVSASDDDDDDDDGKSSVPRQLTVANLPAPAIYKSANAQFFSHYESANMLPRKRSIDRHREPQQRMTGLLETAPWGLPLEAAITDSQTSMQNCSESLLLSRSWSHRERRDILSAVHGISRRCRYSNSIKLTCAAALPTECKDVLCVSRVD